MQTIQLSIILYDGEDITMLMYTNNEIKIGCILLLNLFDFTTVVPIHYSIITSRPIVSGQVFNCNIPIRYSINISPTTYRTSTINLLKLAKNYSISLF